MRQATRAAKTVVQFPRSAPTATLLVQDKINHFWVVAKKELEDRKSKLRNLDREIQDLEEKQGVEIKVRR